MTTFTAEETKDRLITSRVQLLLTMDSLVTWLQDYNYKTHQTGARLPQLMAGSSFITKNLLTHLMTRS